MFSEIQNATTLEELKHAYRAFIKKWHPDNFYVDGELQFEQATEYCKLAHTLYDEQVYLISSNLIKKKQPEFIINEFVGVYYKKSLSLTAIIKLLKERFKEINSKTFDFRVEKLDKVIHVYLSKGSHELPAYQVLSEDIRVDISHPNHELDIRLKLVLAIINNYRITRREGDCTFTVKLTIGKSEEVPYKQIKPSYEKRTVSYWQKEVIAGNATIFTMPKKYQNTGFIQMVIRDLSKEAISEIVQFLPEVLTSDLVNEMLDYFPDVILELPKQFQTKQFWNKACRANPELKEQKPDFNADVFNVLYAILRVYLSTGELSDIMEKSCLYVLSTNSFSLNLARKYLPKDIKENSESYDLSKITNANLNQFYTTVLGTDTAKTWDNKGLYWKEK